MQRRQRLPRTIGNEFMNLRNAQMKRSRSLEHRPRPAPLDSARDDNASLDSARDDNTRPNHRRARRRRALLPSRMRGSFFVGPHIPGVGDAFRSSHSLAAHAPSDAESPASTVPNQPLLRDGGSVSRPFEFRQSFACERKYDACNNHDHSVRRSVCAGGGLLQLAAGRGTPRRFARKSTRANRCATAIPAF